MSALVLLVDDIETNRKLLEAKLQHEYYEVVQAADGHEGLALARTKQPDIILLDVMMPGLDGYQVCRRLKEDPETRHIPVVFTSALDERLDRIRGLELGAEDFLTKPVNTAQLLARMRSTLRLKRTIDELRNRESAGRRMGAIDQIDQRDAGLGARVVVVDDSPIQRGQIRRALAAQHEIFDHDGDAAGTTADLMIVSLKMRGKDGLFVVSKLRRNESTKSLPILAICDHDDDALMLRALDLGADDLIHRPIDEEELQARARTLVKRKRYMQALRSALDQTLGLAVTDQLTGLYNRRFLTNQLQGLTHRAARGGEPVAVVIADIDHFKRINDTFGHGVGDEVLKEFADRVAANFRPADLACRYGGEEFVILMPATRGDYACLVAERLRRQVAATPFIADGGALKIDVTVSLGVAVSSGAQDTADKLLRRADEALYRAKQSGRNRVMAAAA